MTRPLLLDLFCGAGGAAMGYHEAGFDIVGVDNMPQPNYPFPLILADALEYLTTEPDDWYDAIHASPPCQTFTAYRRRGGGVGEKHQNLITKVRAQLQRCGRPYVIENVESAKHDIAGMIRLCGSAFGLDVQRHRLFETSFYCLSPPCDHSVWRPRFPAATNRTIRKTVEVGAWRIPLGVQQRAMGINWMTLPELSQAIPPAYTLFIGTQLITRAD